MNRKVKIGIVGILLLAIMIPAAMSISNATGNGGTGAVANTAGVPVSTLTDDQIQKTKDLIKEQIANNSANIKSVGDVSSKSTGYAYSQNLYQQVTGVDDYYRNYGVSNSYINIFPTVKAWYKQYYPSLGKSDIAPISYSRTYVYLNYWNPYSNQWNQYDSQYKLTETSGEVNFGMASIPNNFLSQSSTTWMITIYSYSAPNENQYSYYTKTFYIYNY